KIPFPGNEKISSLIPANHRQALCGYQESLVSNSSRLSEVLQDSLQSTHRTFLTLRSLHSRKRRRTSIASKRISMILRLQGYSAADIGPALSKFRAASQTLDVIKRQRTLIEEDLEMKVGRRRTTAIQIMDLLREHTWVRLSHSLGKAEVSHIFGLQDGVLSDPRNGKNTLFG
ncbi:uncharacterized protein N7500_006210, partial [Penicillium coprophilum]|uniref:uncharacterized protein n=1 Tax=Penicillium coprophilum TaxID=36646 RepID=UPI0023885600